MTLRLWAMPRSLFSMVKVTAVPFSVMQDVSHLVFLATRVNVPPTTARHPALPVEPDPPALELPQPATASAAPTRPAPASPVRSRRDRGERDMAPDRTDGRADVQVAIRDRPLGVALLLVHFRR